MVHRRQPAWHIAPLGLHGASGGNHWSDAVRLSLIDQWTSGEKDSSQEAARWLRRNRRGTGNGVPTAAAGLRQAQAAKGSAQGGALQRAISTATSPAIATDAKASFRSCAGAEMLGYTPGGQQGTPPTFRSHEPSRAPGARRESEPRSRPASRAGVQGDAESGHLRLNAARMGAASRRCPTRCATAGPSRLSDRHHEHRAQEVEERTRNSSG